MVVGYVLVGALAGLFASVVALLLGASPWLAFSLYALVGSATLVLLPVTRMLVGNLADQGKAPTATDRWNPQSNAPLIEPASDQLVAGTEASFRSLAVDDEVTEILTVSTENAKAMARRLAREGAIFAGTSTGANTVAALRIAARLGSGKTVTTVIVDSGLRYLSTDVFRVPG